MSSIVSIDIKLNEVNIESKQIIETLNKYGWTLIKNNESTYLPIGDDDMFDWVSEKITEESLFHIIDIKENRKELIGLQLFWKDSEIGCDLLMRSSIDFSFSIDINKKYINEKLKMIDFNWYAENLVLCFLVNYNILQYKFEVIH